MALKKASLSGSEGWRSNHEKEAESDLRPVQGESGRRHLTGVVDRKPP